MSAVPVRTREAADLLAVLDQRFSAAAAVLLEPTPADDATRDQQPGAAAAALLPMLLGVCYDRDRDDARWLVLTAAFGAFPTEEQLKNFGRHLELTPPAIAESALLADVLNEPGRGRVDLPMTIVEAGTVVDTDYSARHELHTGIQRVIRETLPRWRAGHPVHALGWIDEYSAFRTLTPREAARIFEYGRVGTAEMEQEAEAAYRPRLVVPWRSVVVLAEVPHEDASGRLAALARFSGNRLSMIGYDMIPITSADTRPAAEADIFAQYLTVVKHAHRLAAISLSASHEFAGFTSELAAQGLPGPEVREVQLAGEAPRANVPRTSRRAARGVMLCVGSHEPHKNQRAALHAAERLWREGMDFEVRLVGGKGWSDDVLQRVIERLLAARRPLTVLGRVSDAQLIDEMQSASFVFFASRHEGYGLPVAEALACGTPVITSNFGSQAEIAGLGGCLMVNPRDDDDITAAVRRLLTDPVELERLRAEAAARPVRRWDEYAEELWDFLVASGRPA